MLHVIEAKYIADYKVWLAFDDNSSGVVDLTNYLKGVVFRPLKDKKLFAKFWLDPELETITWPNGADFAPEFLKKNLQKE